MHGTLYRDTKMSTGKNNAKAGRDAVPVETEDQEGGQRPERLRSKGVLLLLTLVAEVLVVPGQPLRPSVAQQTRNLSIVTI